MEWVFWLAAALLLCVVEVLIVDLLFLMFAGGALAATVAAGLGAPIPIQVAVFGIVSVLLLVAIRPWALRRFKNQTPETATNIAAHVGRTAVVLVATSAVTGRVKLQGEVWSARFDGPGELPVGATVQVVAIDGATAVVVPAPATAHVVDAFPPGAGPEIGGPAAPAYPYPPAVPPAQP